MTNAFFDMQSLTLIDFVLRMGAATLLPFLIGMERFLRRKPIDFRPFVIISVSACGLAVGAMEMMAQTAAPQAQIDPSRVFEGVITGIGFLGAGAMFRRGSFVQGAGSASAIWAAGAIGLICGFGEIWLAATITAIILILLIVSGPFTEEWDPEASHDAPAESTNAPPGLGN